MNRPDLYETTYAHDRREHRHRCQCCSRIINAGELVVMYAIHKGTRALHAECADKLAFPERGVSFRQLAQLHSDEHARKLGFKVERRTYE
jgi:hypothetical protein